MTWKWKRIYICSPLRANDWPGIIRNAIKAQHYMELASAQYECRTYAPHAYLPFILDDTDPDERSLALDFGLKLLKLCDVLIVCGDVISEGMQGEIEQAFKLGIPVQALHGSVEMDGKIKNIMEGLENDMRF